MSLKGKKILITAGPTWVAIDQARVISNLASGETGFILADKLKKLGAKVTLLLGSGNFCGSEKGIKIIRFKYFAQLRQLLTDELKKGKYWAIIHAAAVSDYQTKGEIRNKISSDLKNLKINLIPTEKLIDSFKNYGVGLFTVGFKFEPTVTDNQLIKKAKTLLNKADLNLVVANSNKDMRYRAYILDRLNKYGPFLSKTKMANYLSRLMENQP
jgi:phosphopantothenoylcysteine decarboxylase/phosphopantothenate--cysteine ligase